MLKKGSMVLSIWCIINFILAFIILSYVIVFKQNSPILQVASFQKLKLPALVPRPLQRSIVLRSCTTLARWLSRC